jgi:dihydroxy-acid dehydratase
MFKSDILKTKVETAPHRSLLRASWLKDEDFDTKKPFIGVANSFNNVVPGHWHLNILNQYVMKGIRDAWGVPFTWWVPAICDWIAMFAEMRLSLPSRDHIAENIELMMLSHSFDWWVGITNCDKITPWMLMAAWRLNLPAVILTGGPMQPWRDTKTGKHLDLVSVFEWVWAVQAGKMTEEELLELEKESCPTGWSCAWMFTANSMACVTEVLWMSVKDCAATLATLKEKQKQAYESGRLAVELAKKNIRPRDIMTKEAFEDAMTLDNAIWGSTNVTLHLPAIAKECGIDIDLFDFDRISKNTPNICKLSPSGPYEMVDLYNEGWIKQVMKNIEDKLHLDRIAVDWNLKDRLKWVEKIDNDVIRSPENPYYKEGWVAALKWNICKESVIKQTWVNKDMLVHSWPAKVFYTEQEVVDWVKNGKIQEWDVVVLPYQWPAWAPWMPEMLTPTAAIKWAWFQKVALITDWRFSWGTAGPCIGHIYPEAYNKWRIWLIKDWDIIEIDIPNRTLNVKVSDEEFERRAKEEGFKIPERTMTKMLEKFRKDYAE